MWKISLKDTYFCVLLSKDSRNLIRFQWKRSFYVCLCLSFGLGPAPQAFNKLLKVPMSVLRRLMVWVVITILDDLLRTYSQDETL